jgi:hypothetical protein
MTNTEDAERSRVGTIPRRFERACAIHRCCLPALPGASRANRRRHAGSHSLPRLWLLVEPATARDGTDMNASRDSARFTAGRSTDGPQDYAGRLLAFGLLIVAIGNKTEGDAGLAPPIDQTRKLGYAHDVHGPADRLIWCKLPKVNLSASP